MHTLIDFTSQEPRFEAPDPFAVADYRLAQIALVNRQNEADKVRRSQELERAIEREMAL